MGTRSPGQKPAVVVLLVVIVIAAVAAAIYSARMSLRGPDPKIFPTQGGFPEGAGFVITEEGQKPLGELNKQEGQTGEDEKPSTAAPSEATTETAPPAAAPESASAPAPDQP